MMLRSALVCLTLVGCARPIGVFTPRELLAAGRPREAWAAIQHDADPEEDARLLALHQGALLHAGGAWAESEAAFARAEAGAPGYQPLPAERELIARLRATNALALHQDPGLLAAALPALKLEPPSPGNATLVVVFERGSAPGARVTFDQHTQARQVTVSRDERRQPAEWQLNDEASVAAVLIDSIAPRWSAELEARLRGRQTLGQKLGLDPLSNVREALARPSEWWTPSTDWLVAQRELPPGSHVLTVTTAGGRRARVITAVAGQQVFVVVPQ